MGKKSWLSVYETCGVSWRTGSGQKRVTGSPWLRAPQQHGLSTHVTLSGHAQRLAPVEAEVALAVALACEPVVEAGGEVRVVPEVGVALALDAGGVLGEPGIEGGRGRLSVGAAKVVKVAELGGEGAAAARRLGVVLFEGCVEGGNVVAGEEGLVARPEVVLMSEGWRRGTHGHGGEDLADESRCVVCHGGE